MHTESVIHSVFYGLHVHGGVTECYKNKGSQTENASRGKLIKMQ